MGDTSDRTLIRKAGPLPYESQPLAQPSDQPHSHGGGQSHPHPYSTNLAAPPALSTVSSIAGGGQFLPIKRLLAAQKARKAAQEDVQKLANRLEQLRKEEDKSVRRIAETKKRAQEITEMRKRNEDARQARIHWQQEREQELRNFHDSVLNNKEERRRRRQASAMANSKTKKEEIARLKAEKKRIEEETAMRREEDRLKALQSKEYIRQSALHFRERLLEEKIRNLHKARTEFERRVEEERSLHERKARELSKMAKEEMELIQKLHRRQKQQREAYEELEKALGVIRKGKYMLGGGGGGGGGGPLNICNSDGGGTINPPEEGLPLRDLDTNVSASLDKGISTLDRREEEAAIKAQFNLLDSEGKGWIATRDLGKLLYRLGERLAEPQVARATQQLDGKGAGKIQFNDFLLWWRG
ncbi:hypothetical protein CBR_g30542 [Chara braunii]|uniref:EF-hand domain-containing protein n=1 Tax=Chara braunii TaxID=69332 RepID=A0A388LD08_CHABU|nr:hypothetical protein CBR_g30542 [Chara braunii]|eukprot:GBG80176.1 hypothetical protein CBR_g30542 [Chara braunii]